ncbi:cation:proton antiporter domain-containing protein [Paractinoplanes toevensis]|uniref:Cation/H+ exchanger transmembrane domain-containing protein n=1 Tax=Paractinoplanes toevensis TaxID=571911 RepID=A0A919TF39_9ACTN|nr:cation:proton antiporter [Actinoplanes toevensis]GIM92969.1 hypothetical protein Ato02nite_047620 [Actinoplanes toevensis]
MLYGTAVSAAIASSGHPSVGATGVELLLSFAGGILAGAATATVVLFVRKRIDDPTLENTLSVLTPFAAFLPAHAVHASGTLAVVVCGLALARFAPPHISAATRLRAHSFWNLTAYLLNAALFEGIRVQLVAAARDLSSPSWPQALSGIAVAGSAVIGGRFAFLYASAVLVRLLDRRAVQRARRVGWRQRVPLAWAGVRGGISLAAALAVPAAAPDRGLVIVVTGGVVLTTLLVQGLTLPAVIRWGRMPDDGRDTIERREAVRRMIAASLERLRAEPAGGRAPDSAVMVIEEELRARLASPGTRLTALRLEVLGAERRELAAMHAGAQIDDLVFLDLQSELDREEMTVAPAPAE